MNDEQFRMCDDGVGGEVWKGWRSLFFLLLMFSFFERVVLFTFADIKDRVCRYLMLRLRIESCLGQLRRI